MAKKQSKAAEMKIRKKKWIALISPSFGDRTVGETAVYDSKEALGRTVSINLMNLSGDPRKQNIDIIFRVESLRGETAVNTKVIGYIVQGPALRKMVRRGKTKVTDSFKCFTSDRVPVVLKSFILTRSMVNNSISTKIRQTVKSIAVEMVSEMTFDSLMADIVQAKFQREIKAIVDKIYPTKIFEFNTVSLTPQGKGRFETAGQAKGGKRGADAEAATQDSPDNSEQHSEDSSANTEEGEQAGEENSSDSENGDQKSQADEGQDISQ